MVQVVTMDMGELAEGPSPELLADMKVAETEMAAREMAKRQIASDPSVGGGLRRDYFRHC